MPSMMSTVAIHSSQYPGAIRNELLDSLRRREINHKFHYESVKQAQKWMAVHRNYSPFQTDPECQEIYGAALEAAAAFFETTDADLIQNLPSSEAGGVDVIGLGCGSGQKDLRLLRLLDSRPIDLRYVPCDVSLPLVLTAEQSVKQTVPRVLTVPFVCDLLSADDLAAAFNQIAAPRQRRVITFFGMIPNFEPRAILSRLAGLLERDDILVFSANLAPGADYGAGVAKVLPLYNNPPTRDWLMTLLLDLGIDRSDGEVSFRIEDDSEGFKRITASFDFQTDRRIEIGDEVVTFRDGERVRLFFSYRYQAVQIRELLCRFGLRVIGEWIARSEEEGVFLCCRV